MLMTWCCAAFAGFKNLSNRQACKSIVSQKVEFWVDLCVNWAAIPPSLYVMENMTAVGPHKYASTLHDFFCVSIANGITKLEKLHWIFQKRDRKGFLHRLQAPDTGLQFLSWHGQVWAQFTPNWPNSQVRLQLKWKEMQRALRKRVNTSIVYKSNKSFQWKWNKVVWGITGNYVDIGNANPRKEKRNEHL